MKNLKSETQKTLVRNHLLSQIAACKGKVDMNFMNILSPVIEYCKKNDLDGWKDAFPEIFAMPRHEYVTEHYADDDAFELVDMVVRGLITSENWRELYAMYHHFGDYISKDILGELAPEESYNFQAL